MRLVLSSLGQGQVRAAIAQGPWVRQAETTSAICLLMWKRGRLRAARQLSTCRSALRATGTQPSAPSPAARHTARGSNGPAFDVRSMRYALLGADLTRSRPLTLACALKLVSECGTDMSRWSTCKHFTSWLSLAPDNMGPGRAGPELEDATVRKPGYGPAAAGRDRPEPD